MEMKSKPPPKKRLNWGFWGLFLAEVAADLSRVHHPKGLEGGHERLRAEICIPAGKWTCGKIWETKPNLVN